MKYEKKIFKLNKPENTFQEKKNEARNNNTLKPLEILHTRFTKIFRSRLQTRQRDIPTEVKYLRNIIPAKRLKLNYKTHFKHNIHRSKRINAITSTNYAVETIVLFY